jgi:hypothetical protein
MCQSEWQDQSRKNGRSEGEKIEKKRRRRRLVEEREVGLELG